MANAATTANLRQILLRGLIGIAIGILFLWLAFRDTTWQEVQLILANAHSQWFAVAILTYSVGLSVRVTRWQHLLKGIKLLSFNAVGQALLVGYAMNNVLPARLGELVRANFIGQQSQLSRISVIGSIAVERALDGLIIISCLVAGRLFVSNHAILNRLTVGGSILFIGIFTALWLVSRRSLTRRLSRMPQAVTQRLQKFQQGLSVMQGATLNRAIALSCLIWIFEGMALWSILHAVEVNLNWQQMLSVIGVVSLSTLLPSPPGFVGTYQYAFAFAVSLMGYTSSQGIAAATATQIFLMGSVTFLGLGLYIYTHFARLENKHGG